LVDGEPIEDIVASISEIARAPEQASARIGLQRLEEWRRAHSGVIVPLAPVTYERPSGIFKVNFTADFGMRIGRDAVAVHLWNTAAPTLSPRMAYAALSLFAPIYAATDNPPDDIAVLSLGEPRLYRFRDAGRYAGLGVSLADRIEEMLRDVSQEPAPAGRTARRLRNTPRGPGRTGGFRFGSGHRNWLDADCEAALALPRFDTTKSKGSAAPLTAIDPCPL